MAFRTRAWAFIFYPDDSIFSNWQDIIRDWHVDCIVSPLHSPDSMRSSDEIDTLVHLKRHHHAMLMFDGVKSEDQVINIISSLGKSVTKPFPLHSITGYIRYMVHLDYPDKEQFPDLEGSLFIYGSAGLKVSEAFDIGTLDAMKIINHINKFIVDKNISEFNVLYQYCLVDAPKWAYVLDKFPCRSVHALLSSNRWALKHYEKDS